MLATVRLEESCGKLMVRPIVVAQKYRGQGIGRYLLERVMPKNMTVLLVARGDVVAFYSRMGFSKCSWDLVTDHQVDECNYCPDKEQCGPQPMVKEQAAEALQIK